MEISRVHVFLEGRIQKLETLGDKQVNVLEAVRLEYYFQMLRFIKGQSLGRFTEFFSWKFVWLLLR
jgi:hypothetical protein